MKSNKQMITWSIPALGLAAIITLVAWKQGPRRAGTPNPVAQDTVPAKTAKAPKDATAKDFDKEIRALETARENLKEIDWDQISKSIEQARVHIDGEDIRRQIDEAMEKVDRKKIKADIDKAMKQIDFDKLQRQIDESMKSIDLAKLKADVASTMDKEDFAELRADIQKAVKDGLASINTEDIRKQIDAAKLDVAREMKNIDWNKELADLQEIDTEKIQREMEKARVDIDKAMQELKNEKGEWRSDIKDAWKDIDKAKAELKGYQEMVYDMEAAGLLSTKGDYVIRYSKGALFINDKEQPKATADKYRKYFSHDKTTIRKEQGKMDVEVD